MATEHHNEGNTMKRKVAVTLSGVVLGAAVLTGCQTDDDCEETRSNSQEEVQDCEDSHHGSHHKGPSKSKPKPRGRR